MGPLELLLCAALISCSAWLSASEIALFSLSRFQLRALKERFRGSHRRIKKLLADPAGLLLTILTLNEVLNIALSALLTQSVARTARHPWMVAANAALPAWAPPWLFDTLLGVGVTAPIILILCEISPKVIAARGNQLLAPLAARPLSYAYQVMAPVRWLLRRIVRAAVSDPEHILRESDFLMMVEQGQKEGAVQQTEVDLIKNVFELDDTPVSEVFTPLSLVQTLPLKTTIQGALEKMRHQKRSRIPVTGRHRREVVGILYSKDLLRAKLQPELLAGGIEPLLKKPLTVGPSTRLNALFRKFKQQKTHMAVVQGAAGEALGIVTMSDVLDTLLDELIPDYHPHDEERDDDPDDELPARGGRSKPV